MGSNDHLPTKQQRTARRRRGELRELLTWTSATLGTIAPLITGISEAGGYVGLGRNSTGDALLLYIKLDDWSERIAIESYEQLAPYVAELLEELK
jgi:hypothetical protein